MADGETQSPAARSVRATGRRQRMDRMLDHPVLSLAPAGLDHPLFARHDSFTRGAGILWLECLNLLGRRCFPMFVGNGGLQLLQAARAEVNLQVLVGAHQHAPDAPFRAEFVTDDGLFFEWHLRCLLQLRLVGGGVPSWAAYVLVSASS